MSGWLSSLPESPAPQYFTSRTSPLPRHACPARFPWLGVTSARPARSPPRGHRGSGHAAVGRPIGRTVARTRLLGGAPTCHELWMPHVLRAPLPCLLGKPRVFRQEPHSESRAPAAGRAGDPCDLGALLRRERVGGQGLAASPPPFAGPALQPPRPPGGPRRPGPWGTAGGTFQLCEHPPPWAQRLLGCLSARLGLPSWAAPASGPLTPAGGGGGEPISEAPRLRSRATWGTGRRWH